MPTDMMSARRDVVVPPGFYLFVESDTGAIACNVGPMNVVVSDKENIVTWNPDNNSFDQVNDYRNGLKPFVQARRGEYIVLHNPATGEKRPVEGKKNEMAELSWGETQIIEGPIFFALFPGQSAETIPGHRMRPFQYIIIQITNPDAAMQNWTDETTRPWVTGFKIPDVIAHPDEQTDEEHAMLSTPVEPMPPANDAKPVMGRQYVVTGQTVTYFVPVTGMVVLQDDAGNYLRDAIVLERGEWALFRSESGQKRYEQGPQIVFPRTPDEKVVDFDGQKVNRAIELTDTTGLHVRAMVKCHAYDMDWEVGQERFLTGKEVPFFYPSDELAIVAYDGKALLYSVTIPRKQARYLLEKKLGSVGLVKGPQMFLPNPISQTFVRRILSDTEVDLWFPGNQAALDYNRKLRMVAKGTEAKPTEQTRTFGGEALARAIASGMQYSEPRSVVLESRFDGAVTIDVYDGYAVMVAGDEGHNEVVIGPALRHLEYHEVLVPFKVSQGLPKNHRDIRREAYLRIKNNRVRDQLTVTTKDYVKMVLTLNFVVDFMEEHKEAWWSVGNYVELVSNTMQTQLSKAFRRVTLQQALEDPFPIILEAVLGTEVEGKRPGTVFEQYGIWIKDVKVLDFQIEDDAIAHQVFDTQKEIVSKALQLSDAQRQLELTTALEAIRQQTARAEAETKTMISHLALEQLTVDRELATASAVLEGEKQAAVQRLLDAVESAKRARLLADVEQKQALAAVDLKQYQERLAAETNAAKERLAAITPSDLAMLRQMSDSELLKNLAEKLGPDAMWTGASLQAIVKGLLAGSGFESLGNLLRPASFGDNS
jgi:major vault protein